MPSKDCLKFDVPVRRTRSLRSPTAFLINHSFVKLLAFVPLNGETRCSWILNLKPFKVTASVFNVFELVLFNIHAPAPKTKKNSFEDSAALVDKHIFFSPSQI